ncbi:MAG: 7,8-didemethyl-8-hydroxy-5-deazariboflavin synthase CofG [Candidatus Bathyarchaeota archaeon]
MKMASPEIYDSLEKVIEGREIAREEAYRIIHADIKELPGITSVANLIKCKGKGNVASFSKKVFIPLTNICRNACNYCGFRRTPEDNDAKLLTPTEILKIAEVGKKNACNEALFTMGEKPEETYPKVASKLRALGYESIVTYLRDMCERVIDKTGLLPHSNPGTLTRNEMAELKEVNISMGLMVENTSERLCQTGGPHEFSPGKKPELRLATIEQGGKLKVAFTTGLLIGIGETLEERIDSLFAIKNIHEKYGHIQEIIIQSFRAKKGIQMERDHEPTTLDIVRTVSVARLIFGGGMNIQVPPNLNPKGCGLFLLTGANDWGGISPVTIDYINPEAPWPRIDEVERLTLNAGLVLRERLAMYPEFILMKPNFIPDRLSYIRSRVDEKGYVRNG